MHASKADLDAQVLGRFVEAAVHGAEVLGHLLRYARHLRPHVLDGAHGLGVGLGAHALDLGHDGLRLRIGLQAHALERGHHPTPTSVQTYLKQPGVKTDVKDLAFPLATGQALLVYLDVRSEVRTRQALPEALTSFRAGLAIAERLAKADPGNAIWQRWVLCTLA